MSSDLLNGYRMRPASLGDASGVAEVIAACQAADNCLTRTTVEDVLHDWEGADVGEQSVVVVANVGRTVGTADIINRSYVHVTVYGYVHPDERGRGVGASLIRWGEAWATQRIGHAPPEARVIVEHYVNVANQSACRLLETNGYLDVRHTFVMAVSLADTPLLPEWPPAIAVRNFRPGVDDQATFEAVEDAAKDIWGRPAGTIERFSLLTGATSFDPELWHLALDGDQIAGVCLTESVGGKGWVNLVGVRRPYRGQGLGLALMREAFGAYHRRGIANVSLSVDATSRTGAPRVYARAGMRVVEEYARYQKEVRPGVDLSAR